MKYLFIINPNSGKRNTKDIVKIINNYMFEIHKDYKIVYTSKKEDATKIADNFKNKFDIIYSVGGDGTLNEVVNGIIGGKAKLGIIPVGSGNDFYKTFKDDKSDKLDIGCINNKQHFINITSVGFDADIAEYANYLKEHRYPNDSVYILSLLKNYFKFKPLNIKINDECKTTTLLAVCNGRYYGGGFKIAPFANLNDGKFDIYHVKDINKIKLLNVLLKLLKGKHGIDKSINYSLGDRIRIESEIPLICNIDGEIIKENVIDIKIKPKILVMAKTSNNEILEKFRENKLID